MYPLKENPRSFHLKPHLVGFVEELRPFDRAFLMDAVGDERAFEFRAVIAIEEALHRLKRSGGGLRLVREGGDEIVLFVRDVRIDRDRAVEERLQLRADGIEVDGRGEDDDIRGKHLFENRRRVVLDDALSCFLAGVASRAVTDFLFRDADFRHPMARLLRALRERIAEHIRVAAFARRRRQNQNFLHDDFLSCLAVNSGPTIPVKIDPAREDEAR